MQGSVLQGSSSQQAGAVTQTFESKFWVYLQRAHYRNWAAAPGQDGELYAPRGEDLYPDRNGQLTANAGLRATQAKLYLNRKAAASLAAPSIGSIIVKENFGADDRLVSISVLYFYKAPNLWHYATYNPNGTVASAPPQMGGGMIKGRVDPAVALNTLSGWGSGSTR